MIKIPVTIRRNVANGSIKAAKVSFLATWVRYFALLVLGGYSRVCLFSILSGDLSPPTGERSPVIL